VQIKLYSEISDIDQQQWNALVDNDYPFLRYEFLAAMEANGCVGEHAGWIPRHLVCHDEDGTVLGALPLYEKHNSWGEFVFDHAWADAYHRAGMEYYPKLVNAIPFTPATGQRVLVQPARRQELCEKMLSGLRQFMQQHHFSGAHSLFVNDSDFDVLQQHQPLMRIDCQFHWHNRNYENFEQFLATLKAKKRKNIRQERRKVLESGVIIKRLDGHTASEQDWQEFTAMYREIYDRKFGSPAFNVRFFKQIAAALPDSIVLVLVYTQDVCIAGALMYADKETLYGRHWGCRGYLDSLHFEVCYYQGIEYCIERGLKRFDPGAQGEHKIARGFIPTQTRSLHWITQQPFREAIADFVEREQSGVRGYMRAVAAHSPYQSSPPC